MHRFTIAGIDYFALIAIVDAILLLQINWKYSLSLVFSNCKMGIFEMLCTRTISESIVWRVPHDSKAKYNTVKYIPTVQVANVT